VDKLLSTWQRLNNPQSTVEELLKHKDLDVNIKDKYKQIALYFASKWNNIPKNLFRIILEKSTDVNVQDESGNTALNTPNIPIDLFRVILEKSTDVNAQDKHGWTALHWAIAMENRTAVEELLKRKDVDVNLKNKNNQTARFFSTFWKDMPIDLLSILLEK
jgi:ankyrin repeat protein